MKADKHIKDSHVIVPDKEILGQMRSFAELIFETWKEQRSICADKVNSPIESQAIDCTHV